jgi:hypothetical protein
MAGRARNVNGPNGPFSSALLMPTGARSRLRKMLPPIENRDPGDETAEDES